MGGVVNKFVAADHRGAAAALGAIFMYGRSKVNMGALYLAIVRSIYKRVFRDQQIGCVVSCFLMSTGRVLSCLYVRVAKVGITRRLDTEISACFGSLP